MIGLNQIGPADQRLEEKWHQRRIVFLRQCRIDGIEFRAIIRPQIGRREHPQQHRLDLALAQLGQDRIEVGAGLLRRQPAQHVVAAQADNHQHGRLRQAVQGKAQPLQPAGGGIARYPGIHDPRIDPARAQGCFEPGRIALPRLQPVARKQAVPQCDDLLFRTHDRDFGRGFCGAGQRRGCGRFTPCQRQHSEQKRPD